MTLDHPDYLALTAAVLADPADDMPRLVAADWLEENAKDVECPACKGDGRLDADHRAGTIECRGCVPWGSGRVPNGFAEYGEFIRVQVKIAGANWRECGGYYCQTYDTGNVIHVDCQPERLRVRESELWPRVVGSFDLPDGWLVDIHPRGTDRSAVVRRGFVDEIRCPLRLWMGGECERCGGGGQRVGADRPFEYTPNAVEALRCPACHGLGTVGGIGPELVRRCPLSRVTLSDREPHETRSPDPDFPGWMWCRNFTRSCSSDPWGLPPEVFDLLVGYIHIHDRPPYGSGGLRVSKFYLTQQAALDALSAACLEWARATPTNTTESPREGATR